MKKKILIVAPYGMTLRQIVLNKKLWEYLTNKYKVHIKTSISIEKYTELGIDKIITPEKNIIFSCLERIHQLSKESKIVNFLIENNLGEHLIFRLKYIENFSKKLYSSYFFKKFEGIVKLLGINKIKLFFVLRFSQVKKENYHFVFITHISETMCELESIAANQINVPVITYTLGMDNYRHGRILFQPDLKLMWGEEQKYEFLNWHKNDFNSINEIECKVVGNLIYDTYLQYSNSDMLDKYVKQKKMKDYDGYIVVPTMINKILPGGVGLVKAIVKYLQNRKLNFLVIVRMLPGSEDKKSWQELERNYKKEIIIYEPSAGSFDKRGAVNIFKVQDELKEVEIFSAMLSKSCMVVNLYPSSVTLDAYLFNTPVISPLFDWINSNIKDSKEHPFTKLLYSKFATHSYHREFNPVFSYKELYEAMDNIIEGNSSKYIGNKLFKEVCGQSKEGNVGKRTIKAIEQFMDKCI